MTARFFWTVAMSIWVLGCSMAKEPAGGGKEAWLTDFEAAKARAAELKRPILADFSGSDWCGWCIRLDREVFQTAIFQEFAAQNLVLFIADFPQKSPQPAGLKKQNEALAKRYGIQGFPTVLLLDATGREVARTGYQRGGPEAYIKHLQELLKSESR